MTAYQNFVSDFPERCVEVLDLAAGKSRLSGREVTLLIMAASTSLIVPFERLKTKGDGAIHPIGDVDQFPDAAQDLRELLDDRFIGSAVWRSDHSESWRLAKNLRNITGDPEQWLAGVKLKPISGEKKVKAISELMRNALAHGNLFTRGDPIEEIVLVNFHWKEVPNEPSQLSNFDALVVAPADLETMLRAWVRFLSQSAAWKLMHAA